MPLFVTALSVPLLGERVGWRRWAAVAVGFGGVLLMTRPGGGLLDAVVLIALFSALGYALAVICMRRLGSTESSATTTFYFTVTGATVRSEEHTSELQSLMRISYAVFCLKKKKIYNI